MKNLSFERAEERKHEMKRERREDETESRVWGLGFGKNKKNRRDVRRSPSTVLREEHEKLKSRPSSFVQDRGPVLRKIGRARSRIEPLRDDICGLRKFSFSRERSELSKSLVVFFRSYRQPTTSNVQRFSRAHAPPQAVPPARAGN